MKDHLEKIEEAISRTTNEQERDDLKSALFDLRAISNRNTFDEEIEEAKQKAIRRKLLPVRILCAVAAIFNAWWHVSLFLDGGHYTMRQKLVTFADKPILYTINAVGWVILGAFAMVLFYWVVKLILIDQKAARDWL